MKFVRYNILYSNYISIVLLPISVIATVLGPASVIPSKAYTYIVKLFTVEFARLVVVEITPAETKLNYNISVKCRADDFYRHYYYGNSVGRVVASNVRDLGFEPHA